MIKLSRTVSNILFHVIPTLDTSSISPLFHALRAQAKRKGRKVVYPCDFKAIPLVFESTHEVSGKTFYMIVENGNVSNAIELLSYLIKNEDNRLENQFACY